MELHGASQIIMTDDNSERRHGDEGRAVCPARHSRGPRNPLRRRGHLLGRGRRPARGGAGGVTGHTGTIRLQLLSGVTSKTQPRGFHAKPGRTCHAWCGPFARAETPRVTRTAASTSVFLDTGLFAKTCFRQVEPVWTHITNLFIFFLETFNFYL